MHILFFASHSNLLNANESFICLVIGDGVSHFIENVTVVCDLFWEMGNVENFQEFLTIKIMCLLRNVVSKGD